MCDIVFVPPEREPGWVRAESKRRKVAPDFGECPVTEVKIGFINAKGDNCYLLMFRDNSGPFMIADLARMLQKVETSFGVELSLSAELEELLDEKASTYGSTQDS